MDKGVADKLKKRKQDDADKDEGPPAGSDQGLKRRKMSKDVEPSKKEKTWVRLMIHPLSRLIQRDWFKKPKRPPTPNPEWNTGKTVDDEPTQKWLSDLAKVEKPSKTFNELMSTPIDFTAFAMNNMQISDLTKADLGIEDMVPTLWSPVKVAYDRHAAFAVTNVKLNKWYGYGHLEDIEVRRSDQNLYKFMESDFPRLHLNDVKDMLLLVVQNRLFNLNGDVIVHLAASLRMYTRRIVI
ncbi:hypothetical protein Tco_1141505 [Tanacetum coccineum]